MTAALPGRAIGARKPYRPERMKEHPAELYAENQTYRLIRIFRHDIEHEKNPPQSLPQGIFFAAGQDVPGAKTVHASLRERFSHMKRRAEPADIGQRLPEAVRRLLYFDPSAFLLRSPASLLQSVYFFSPSTCFCAPTTCPGSEAAWKKARMA
ncbi:MAG: hypothetical protein LBF50_09200 [Azoarcus sp.]|jgi:hypothetical protein|nr:hypothetical protein [Azoarcus sp.]